MLNETTNSIVHMEKRLKDLRAGLEIINDPDKFAKLVRGGKTLSNEGLNKEFARLEYLFDELNFDTEVWGKAIDAAGARLDKAQKKVTDVKQEIRNTEEEIKKLPRALTQFEIVLKKADDAAKELLHHMADLVKITDPLEKAIRALEDAKTSGAPPGRLRYLQDVIDQFIHVERVRKLKEATLALEESVAELYKSQRLMSETFGMSSDEAELYALQLERLRLNNTALLTGVKPFDDLMLRLTARMIDHNKKLTEWVSLLDEAKDLVEGLVTPMENYRREVEKIQHMRDKGVLTEEFFNRAMKDAKDRLDDATNSAEKLADQIGRVDAALAGGAEARSRIFEFRENLNEQRNRVPDKDKGVPPADKERNEYLRQQLDQLVEIKKKIAAPNPAANLP